MSKTFDILDNEQGSVIIATLFILVITTVIGVAATNMSTVELDIAGNDARYKRAFYAADGGTELGIELLEQNIEERSFGGAATWGNTNIVTDDFWSNTESGTPANNIASATNRDAEIPNFGGGNVFLKIYGNTQLTSGAALQIAAGYEGKGKGISGGGAFIVYDIRAFAEAPLNSRARVQQQWRHLL